MIKFSEMVTENVNSSLFKLGLDVHGVIDAMPDTFSFLFYIKENISSLIKMSYFFM